MFKNKKGIGLIPLILIIVLVLVIGTVAIVLVLNKDDSSEESTDKTISTSNKINSDKNNDKNESDNNGKITISSVKKAKETDASKFDYIEIDGGVSITDYSGKDEIVVIPEKIDGKTVVSIGKNAFVNNDTMRGLKISNSVHIIENSSCTNCTELQVFVSGTSLKIIEENAFLNTKLEYVELNEGLETLEISSFGFTHLKEIEIPSSVKNINLPFLVDEVNNNGSITIIGEAGSAAEQYVNEYGEEYHLTFQAK